MATILAICLLLLWIPHCKNSRPAEPRMPQPPSRAERMSASGDTTTVGPVSEADSIKGKKKRQRKTGRGTQTVQPDRPSPLQAPVATGNGD